VVSVAFAEGACDEQLGEVASAVEDREDDDVIVTHGEHHPVTVDDRLAVAVDAFGCELWDDTAVERHRRERRDLVRDAPREVLGCTVPVPSDDMIVDAEQIVECGAGPADRRAGGH